MPPQSGHTTASPVAAGVVALGEMGDETRIPSLPAFVVQRLPRTAHGWKGRFAGRLGAEIAAAQSTRKGVVCSVTERRLPIGAASGTVPHRQ